MLPPATAAVAPATPKVPPATPACEHNPIVASAEKASAAPEEPQLGLQQQQRERLPLVPRNQPQATEDEELRRQPKQQDAGGRGPQQQARRQRDIIEELASVKHKKHARHHHRKSSSRQQQARDISHLLDFKWTDKVTRRPRNDSDGGADGSPHHRATWCVPADSPSDSPADSPAHQRREYASAASQEVAKLKMLEKSYAEVLRLRKPAPPSNCKSQSQYFGRK